MKKLSLILIIASFVILGCARKEEPLKGEKGGKMVIGTTDLPGVISPLQPSVFGSSEILDLLFLKLHRIDSETGKMKPELASSWEFSEDLTAITYYLRKDVKWWDGEPVTAEDVLFTFEKMRDPKTNYPLINTLRFIKKVELINKYAIKFTFTQVYADLLTDSDIMPVPKHIYEKSGSDFGTKKIVGNGPYKVKEWVPGVGLILIANEDYYRGRPPLDEIYVKYYSDLTAMVNDFEQGNLDLVLNLTPEEANKLSGNKNISISTYPGNTYTYIGWNLNNEYLRDKEFRRALSMTIDKSKILNTVFSGMGKISLGPIPPSSWAYNESITPIEYNPQKAKEILRKKGFEDRNRNNILDKNGKDLVLLIITNIESQERVQILKNITENLSQIGIKVNGQTLDANSFITALVNKKYDGFIMGWSVGDKIDPALYWHSDPNKGRYNFSGYKNSTIDSLIEVGVTMLNRSKAKEIWNEFQRIIYEDQPYTFLVVPNEISGCYKRIKGVEQGIRLASAYTYWIPESERRVSVAVAVQPTPAPTVEKPKPEVKPEAPKPAPVIAPEKLLEAAAKKETTVVAPPKVEEAPPTPPPPKPAVITKPIPIKQVTPKYPESAKAIGATGRIVVRVVVGTDGKVKAATIISSFGNPACEEAALNAARQWEFKPATRDGEPFEQNISIPFDFKP
uniref:TonB family protein n=1 Tax=candidate division WOR-3 bacterium TaxID=2052148 RepID=A0A7C4TDZ2_UNCW3